MLDYNTHCKKYISLKLQVSFISNNICEFFFLIERIIEIANPTSQLSGLQI